MPAPGIQIFERDKAGFVIEQTPVSRPLFFVRSTSGPTNDAILITGWDEYRSIFGEGYVGDYSYDEMYHYFRNGGRECYIVRVVDGTEATATGTLQTPSASTTGEMFSSIDPLFGVGGLVFTPTTDTMTVAVNGAAGVFGSVGASGQSEMSIYDWAVDAAGFKLGPVVAVGQAQVDDTQHLALYGTNAPLQTFPVVTFAIATAQDVCDLINAGISGAFAYHDAATDLIMLRSSTLGSNSEISQTLAGTFTVGGSGVFGVGDFADYANPTFAEVKAFLEAAWPGTVVSAYGTNSISWATAAPGPAPNGIEVTIADTLGPKLGFAADGPHTGSNTMIPANTITVSATSPGEFANSYVISTTQRDEYVGELSTDISIGAGQLYFDMVTARNLQLGDNLLIDDSAGAGGTLYVTVKRVSGNRVYTEGSFTNPGPIIAAATAKLYRLVFDLDVEDFGVVVGDHSWTDLSMSDSSPRYVETVINSNDPHRKISVSVISPAPSSDPRPDDQIYLAGGLDGSTPAPTDYTATFAPILGLYDDFTEIYAPPASAMSVVNNTIWYRAVEGLAEQRKDFAFLYTPPELAYGSALTATQLTDWKQGAGGSGGPAIFSTYGIGYYPWIIVEDSATDVAGSLKTIPPIGAALGVYAQNDRDYNYAVTPANKTGVIRSALSVTRQYNETERANINNARMNLIRSIRNKGIRLYGARTSGTGDFGYLNVRRAFIRIEKSVEEGLADVVFMPNDEKTRGEATRSVTIFLYNLWKAGILQGATVDEAFFVICNEDNNPPLVAYSGRFVMRIGLAIASPAEFVEIYFERDRRAINEEIGLQQL